MTDNRVYKNAVLDDLELQAGLKSINPKFGDFVIRVAGEAWDLPLIDQKTKALMAIAIDVVNQNHKGPGNPFAAHLDMAFKQGAAYEEIEELLLFMCVYAGFNKVASCFGTLNKIFEQSSVELRNAAMISAIKKADYAIRDQNGTAVFYVLLWKRKSITLDLFDDYWRNVHGPVCARLPGQHQYWQFHLANNQGDLWPTIEGIEYDLPPEDQFDGIAELTFETEVDRQTWFKSAAILMDDERNIFSKAIGYITNSGNSQTYIDSIPTGAPNGNLNVIKFHVMVKKSDAVSVEAFRRYMTDSFAPAVVQSDSVVKFRLHLLEEVDNSRPDAPGVSHYEAPEKQYQAAFEIAFANPLEMETFFASKEYAIAVQDQAKYVQQILPFPERTAYTFVYESKITLAGQCSSKVADLIMKVGATNQLKDDIVSLMNGTQNQQNGKSGLGHYLQGVQHFGITVYDMPKSLEFYLEVLGGKVAIGGDGFYGEALHNLLFQKEEVEAIEKGIDPKALGVANIRDGSDMALDVRFISFGNTVVEIIHFRDAKLTLAAPNAFEKIPSSVGYTNAPHLSFYVKDDVDIDVFAKELEDECQRRGLTEVVVNRIVRANSAEEMKKLAPKFAKTDFTDDFEGWALFYCKGPNGEQLEFNQVTRKAKENFTRAETEYNQANGTNYWFLNSQKPKSNTQGLYATYSIPVNAPLETVWDVLLDKMQNPQPYIPHVVEEFKILERYNNGILRKIRTPRMQMKEKVTVDEQAKKVIFTLVDHPLFTGELSNQVTLPANHNSGSLPIVTYTIDLQPTNDKALEQEEAEWFIKAAQPEAIAQAVHHLKNIIENQVNQESNTMILAHSQTFVGTKSEIVKRMFQAGESMNVENFIKFYTDDAHYQFSNFPVAYGPQGIRDSSVDFLATVAKVYHHIKNMWEVGDTVICEMDVTYIRHDGKVFTLPCCDTIVFKGDKVQELRIYMNIDPVFVFDNNETQSKPASSSGSLTKTLEKMYAALHAENWDEFMTFFTPNLLYKIGANDPVIGPEACRDLLSHIYKTLKLTTHNTRGMWEIGNTIILEMDANYIHKVDKRFVQVPCTDIYRFDGDKIYEWRVYPDASQTGVRI
ncbi:ethyl tert-butyl ether degradation EthD [Nostoc commune NIES-4072]|uniref:Ethyl tert-butyl ether degradation EthD n=1 Tax=Nostoc commune NIES-4072 TaxID=2005467 RepID=A0A2R5FY94_NOSCO|nr:AtaL-like protein [Nostoc commune]BBD70580.1 ethyl tert-butyl ether degradation EthD [Nostoc commune HK-02]GBG23235.1 ethyl tert-butyl ether degradation EthD [Nostoc commune NIES-4072]